MGNEKQHDRTRLEENVCVVESTDDNGSVVGRDAFKTQAEGHAHADIMRAKGYKVTQSSLGPKP